MRRIMMTLALSAALFGTAAYAQDNSYGGDDQSAGQTSDQQGDMAGEESSMTEDQAAATEGDAGMSEEQTMAESEEVYEPAQQGGEAGEAGMAADQTGTTTREAGDVTKGALEREIVGIKPQVGALVFTDTQGGNETSTRAAYGLTVDMNAFSTFAPDNDMLRNWYLGPSTGFIYSHLGAGNSDFFGFNAEGSSGSAGANFFYVPLNLKLGYTVAENYRLAVHGGGNVVYRSVANSMNLSDDLSDQLPGSDTSIYPNVGADLEVGLGSTAALMLRPDVTITPGDDIFTGTLALNIPLG